MCVRTVMMRVTGVSKYILVCDINVCVSENRKEYRVVRIWLL